MRKKGENDGRDLQFHESRQPVMPGQSPDQPFLSGQEPLSQSGSSEGAGENRNAKTPILYTLKKTARKSVQITINAKENGVDVRAPYGVSIADVERILESKRDWIEQKLAYHARWRKEHGVEQLRFLEGNKMLFRGMMVRLHFAGDDHPTSLVIRDGEYILAIDVPANAEPSRVREHVESWVRSEARRVIGDRLTKMLKIAPRVCRQWRLSHARTQWGCCTSAGNIRLNWRLIFFDNDVIDYVIAHELSHLVEMNHSSRFWSQVHALKPDYELQRCKLKAVLMSELPF